MVKKRACVFISGKGTNLENLIKNSRNYNFPINIKLVITNNSKAEGLKIAKKNSIAFKIIDIKKRSFENEIIKYLKIYDISLICLAGYMQIISKKFLNRYGKDIINIHPSLLPKYKGLNTFSRVIKNRDKKTGCSVHHVNDKLDGGKIIIQKSFEVNFDDKENDLKIKTQKLEYLAFPEAIIELYRYN